MSLHSVILCFVLCFSLPVEYGVKVCRRGDNKVRLCVSDSQTISISSSEQLATADSGYQVPLVKSLVALE